MAENTDIMSALDAAAFLGAHVETIRRLARRGEIPSFKVGKDWRFRRATLRQWSETQRTRLRSLLVLTVDDDSGVCQTISRAVERLGCRGAIAGSGRAGLMAVAHETPGLILLDLMMPEMNGVEFLRELRLLHPGLPVAIITGYPEGDMIVEAMKYGPLLVLPKPVDEQQLKWVLQMAAGMNSLAFLK
jgi:excisionase family DNA binding protein